MNPARIPASASQLLARDRCAEEADNAFERLIADIYARPTSAVRSLTITINLAPRIEVDGNNRNFIKHIKAVTEVSYKLPPAKKVLDDDTLAQRGGERHLMMDADRNPDEDPNQIHMQFPEEGEK